MRQLVQTNFIALEKRLKSFISTLPWKPNLRKLFMCQTWNLIWMVVCVCFHIHFFTIILNRNLHIDIMANISEIESNCQILNDHNVDSKININDDTAECKVNENEGTLEICVNEQNYSSTEPVNQDNEEKDDILDDRSEYDAESFCSDDSYKELEMMNITSRSSHSDCSLLLHDASPTDDEEKLKKLERKKNKRLALRLQEFNDCKEISSLEDGIKYLAIDEIHMGQRRMRNGRKNMSFTNDQMRKIQWDNLILLRKIMSFQKSRNKPPGMESVQPRASSSAINRKRLQKKIQEENMMLLRRLQQTKSCAMTRTTTPGYRLTFI